MKSPDFGAAYDSKSSKPSVKRVFCSKKPHRISRHCQSLSMRGSEATAGELPGKIGIGRKQSGESEECAFVTVATLTKSARAQRKNETTFDEQSTNWPVSARTCWLNAGIGVTALPTRRLEKSKNS